MVRGATNKCSCSLLEGCDAVEPPDPFHLGAASPVLGFQASNCDGDQEGSKHDACRCQLCLFVRGGWGGWGVGGEFDFLVATCTWLWLVTDSIGCHWLPMFVQFLVLASQEDHNHMVGILWR